jgi:hypothetical protein
MADSKISALPASTTPLAGTEVLPIVQSSTTKQVSVANLTAGRAISATQITLTTGNLIVASGQGVDFSATPGTGTSELLADYEEGTWTPTSNTITFAVDTAGTYTKIGRLVTLNFVVNFPVTADTNVAYIRSLPFTCVTNAGVAVGNYNSDLNIVTLSSNTILYPLNATGTVAKTNVALSGQSLWCSVSYMS